jgi:hypothetical protein
VDEPRLRDLGHDAAQDDHKHDLAHDRPLRLGRAVLGGQAHAQDMVDRAAHVLVTDRAVRADGNVRLALVKQLREGRAPAPTVRGPARRRRCTVVAHVLREQRRRVETHERWQIRGLQAHRERAQDVCEDRGHARQQVPVEAGELRPPRVHERAQRERDKVVQLRVERIVRRSEQHWQGLVGRPCGEQQPARERGCLGCRRRHGYRRRRGLSRARRARRTWSPSVARDSSG